jgi:hypothetical protein
VSVDTKHKQEEKLSKPRLDLHPLQGQQYLQTLWMLEPFVEIYWDRRALGDENLEQQQSLHLALLYKKENWQLEPFRFQPKHVRSLFVKIRYIWYVIIAFRTRAICMQNIDTTISQNIEQKSMFLTFFIAQRHMKLLQG